MALLDEDLLQDVVLSDASTDGAVESGTAVVQATPDIGPATAGLPGDLEPIGAAR